MKKLKIYFLMSALMIFFGFSFIMKSVFAVDSIDIWWPAPNRIMTGVQPFKALLQNNKITDYKMYWQVDSGGLVEMYNSYEGYPHKEAKVDFANWNWKGSGPYTIKFVAKNKTGSTLNTKTVVICVRSFCLSPTSSPTPTPTVTNPLVGKSFYVDPNSSAKKQYDSWRLSNPDKAKLILKIANESIARWFGGWNASIESEVNAYVSAAATTNTIPVLVAYNIPQRDCGGQSAGGVSSSDSYKSWITAFAKGINNRKAVVILEPDSVANITCLSEADQKTRYELLSYAIETLRSKGAIVYLDAGHSNWVNTQEMAARLKKAGIDKAQGFSLNVSNFIDSQKNIDYGNSLSGFIGGKHFIIDTGRNGLGSSDQWCNPPGRALGSKPTSNTGRQLVDAYLWIKPPGESDGSCNGGPSAGTWWAEYALGLSQRAAY